MEAESVVILLFTFSRIEKLLGWREFSRQLGPQPLEILRYFVRDMLHKKRFELHEFISTDPSKASRIVKLTMIVKALTFNRHALEDSFKPYISEILD